MKLHHVCFRGVPVDHITNAQIPYAHVDDLTLPFFQTEKKECCKTHSRGKMKANKTSHNTQKKRSRISTIESFRGKVNLF